MYVTNLQNNQAVLKYDFVNLPCTKNGLLNSKLDLQLFSRKFPFWLEAIIWELRKMFAYFQTDNLKIA